MANSKKHYRTHKVKKVLISLRIAPGVLKLVDEAAAQEFSSRSALIHRALLWYLQPQGRELNQADPDVILKTLQRRKAMATMPMKLEALDFLD